MFKLTSYDVKRTNNGESNFMDLFTGKLTRNEEQLHMEGGGHIECVVFVFFLLLLLLSEEQQPHNLNIYQQVYRESSRD